MREFGFRGGLDMRISSKACLASFYFAVTLFAASSAAHGQTITGSPTVALKSGETFELGNIYWVSHCKSILKSTPEAEILDGPPGVSVSVKEAMVIPRQARCGNRVPGGTVVITAKDIEDPSYSNLTVRFTFKTKDGERKYSQVFNLSLAP